MDSNEPVRRTPEEFVNALTENVAERLNGFGLDIDPSEAATVITRWAENVTAEQTFERSAVLYANDKQMNEMAESLVSELLAEIAEERPGTDPWEHEATIPFPLPILLMQITYLALCSNLAIRNGADRWALTANANSASIADIIVSQITLETPEVVEHRVLHGTESRKVYGQTVMLPQPGLANLARFYENVVFHVERSLWEMAPDADPDERQATLGTLRTHAALMRDLNTRYGRPAGPRRNS